MAENIRKSEEPCLKISDETKTLEIERIIREYKEQNNIEILTEEELLDLIPESALYPNLYLTSSGRYSDSGLIISDYELYLLLNGYNPFEDEGSKYLEELQQTVDGIDLGDADFIDEGEWECSLEEELEHYLSLRTKTIEVYVTDAKEVINLLNSRMDETTYSLIIHWNTGDRKFRIIRSDEEQFYFYQVILEFDSNNGKSSLYLGSDTWCSSVLGIIGYYLETGNSTEDN
jgi:hypothetical protein